MRDQASDSMLLALAEIHGLEAERVAQEDRRRQARVLAEARAADEAQRRARLEEARLAKMEAARQAREAAAREAAEREARIRRAEAELRARAEAEAERAREQRGLDEQLRRRADRRPIAVYAVITALMLGVAGGAAAAAKAVKRGDAAASEAAEAAAASAASRREFLASLEGEIEGLRARQRSLGDELAAANAVDLARPIAPAPVAAASEGRSGPRRPTSPRPRTEAAAATPVKGAGKIEIVDTDDPLAGAN